MKNIRTLVILAALVAVFAAGYGIWQVVGKSNSPSSGKKLYSLSDVAQHSRADDCWTVIDGKVYDLTPFIPTHPGGDRILAVCGIDGTSAFSEQHGEPGKPQQQLAKLQIGELRQ